MFKINYRPWRVAIKEKTFKKQIRELNDKLWSAHMNNEGLKILFNKSGIGRGAFRCLDCNSIYGKEEHREDCRYKLILKLNKNIR